MLTKKEKSRRTVIIRELSRLSRNGWANATSDDYAPLEAELNALNARAAIAKAEG
jgi:hypothetical protein